MYLVVDLNNIILPILSIEYLNIYLDEDKR